MASAAWKARIQATLAAFLFHRNSEEPGMKGNSREAQSELAEKGHNSLIVAFSRQKPQS
jgi:hypothetical protein